MDRSTWLITGASSGLGYALAEYVLQQGDQVVAAARTLEPMAALTERYPDAGLALPLDVTDSQQRADAIGQAEARFGAIDILVNNAGIDFIGAIEEQAEKDYRARALGHRPTHVLSLPDVHRWPSQFLRANAADRSVHE
jgi:NADP-dependent 3-hydroxy acid dehydrogenase YdfG